MYNRRWHKGVCAVTSLQEGLSVEMGSVFIVTCRGSEKQSQSQAVTRHRQVVSKPRDTVSDQPEPDAAGGGGAGGGGVLLIP